MKRLWLVPLAIASGVCSGKEAFGDWVFDVTPNGEWMYALTANDADEVVGRWCAVNTGMCHWSIGTRAECNFGQAMQLLMAVLPKGVASMVASCHGRLPGGSWSGYKVDDPRLLDYHTQESLGLSFCAPTGQDDFHVMSFSLTGARQATSILEQRFKGRLL